MLIFFISRNKSNFNLLNYLKFLNYRVCELKRNSVNKNIEQLRLVHLYGYKSNK